ncbi:hypothetical protein WMY93_033417 [Mugilogobius chulae]|uniref:Uncharacterized protein n=1 Tax=Mugilogobius chulae TaxID=88201 RepID=A0AAW0MLA8_9GOBI
MSSLSFSLLAPPLSSLISLSPSRCLLSRSVRDVLLPSEAPPLHLRGPAQPHVRAVLVRGHRAAVVGGRGGSVRDRAELVNASGAELGPFLGPWIHVPGPGLVLTLVSVPGGSTFLVLVVFASEVKIRRVTEHIANFKEQTFVFRTHSERYERSYWLFLLVFFLQSLNALLTRLSGIEFPFQDKPPTDAETGAADLMY